MKKTLILLTTILIGVLVLSGCKKSNSTSSIIGSWNHEGYIYSFNSDKTGTYSLGDVSIPYTYEDYGNKIVLQFDGSENINTYYYKIEKGKLIMKNDFNEDVEYKKNK